MIADAFEHQTLTADFNCPNDVTVHQAEDLNSDHEESDCDHENKCQAICVTTSSALTLEPDVQSANLKSNVWQSPDKLIRFALFGLQIEKPPKS